MTTKNLGRHAPVLPTEVLEYADAGRPGVNFVDGTFGRGGHTRLILEKVDVATCLLVDRDPEAMRAARELANDWPTKPGLRFVLQQGSFSDLRLIMDKHKIPGVDLILLDLGVSSPQLDDPSRGFSFQTPGPLDMRMNPAEQTSAATLIATLPERELADILFQYGEERASRKIARAIVKNREIAPIRDTLTLANLIESVLPRSGRLHPATRSFQALRIAVNRELQEVESVLKDIPALLNPSGRAIIISFHSLEDRIVKTTFQAWKRDGLGAILTKKCVMASDGEIMANPRARSARLRCFEKAA